MIEEAGSSKQKTGKVGFKKRARLNAVDSSAVGNSYWFRGLATMRAFSRHIARPGSAKVPLWMTRRAQSIQSHLPKIAQPTIWQSMIPKFLKRSDAPRASKKSSTRDRNPATVYVIIFLLIGSNAMQGIATKREMANFSRNTDAQIGLLKEVIKRIQNGEKVDVEDILGTGDPVAEKDWERGSRISA